MTQQFQPPVSAAVLAYASPYSVDAFPASGRARATVILNAIHAILRLAYVGVLIPQHILLVNAGRGIRPTPAEAQANDLRVALIGVPTLAVGIAALVLLLCWIYRVYRNMHALRMYPDWQPGWAVGYWFIPILNFFRVYQEAVEILKKNGGRVGETGGVGKLWYLFWFLSVLLPTIYPLWWATSSEIERLTAYSDALLIGSIAGIGANVLLIVWVRRAQTYQENEIMHAASPDAPGVVYAEPLHGVVPPPAFRGA